MKSKIFVLMSTITVFAVLGIQIRVAAQDQQEQKAAQPHRYTVINLGSLLEAVCFERRAEYGQLVPAASATGAVGGCISVRIERIPRGRNDDVVDAWTQARAALGGADVANYSMYTAGERCPFRSGTKAHGVQF